VTHQISDDQRAWLLRRIEQTLAELDTTSEENKRAQWLLGGMAHAYVEVALQLGLYPEDMLRALVRRYAYPSDLSEDLRNITGG
jgi:hypothetical protein